jgi:rare lipoprotein A
MFYRFILGVFPLLIIGCSRPAYQEQGWASCIADEYAGRPTTSGQPYYPQAFTAAHASLPFGSQCKIKNLQTGQQVTVVVNDRFPYYPGRIINLSHAAAQQIGLPYSRLCQVRVQSYPPTSGVRYQQPVYQTQPMYRQQAASQQPQQSYARVPKYAAPKYTAPSYTTPKPSFGPGAPNAPAFNGGGPPLGLKTF